MLNDEKKGGLWSERERLDMPPLQDLHTPLVPLLLAGPIFGSAGAKSPNLFGYLVCLGRDVDKVILDYETARETLQTYYDGEPYTEGLGLYMRASAFMESCLSTMHRALRIVDRINRHPTAPKVPRHLEVLSTRARSLIEDFRHAAEHMDSQIAEGKSPSEEHPSGVSMGKRQLGFEGEEITYQRLARWIRQLHRLTAELLVQPERSPVTE